MPDSIAFRKNYSEIKLLDKKFKKGAKDTKNGDLNRLIFIVLNIRNLLDKNKVKGEFAELGVWKGNASAVFAFYAKKYDRHLHLFDTFSGFDSKDLKNVDSMYKQGQFSNTSIDIVKKNIGTDINSCSFHVGYFPNSIPEELNKKKFAIVSLDADLYEPTKAALEWFFPRMENGALFFLHDYSGDYWHGCKKAIDEFCQKKNQNIILIPDMAGTAVMIVQK